jgi:hypothetical protein
VSTWENVYLRYAEHFISPAQIDDVDETAIPGFAAGAASDKR